MKIEINLIFLIILVLVSFIFGGIIIGPNDDIPYQKGYNNDAISCLEEYSQALEESNELIYYISGEIEDPEEYFANSQDHLDYIFDVIQNNWPEESLCDPYSYY